MIVSTFPMEISDTVRIDVGPPIKRSLATEKTLANDYTAGHYQEGKPDAFGKPIIMGKQFHYVDWKSGGDELVYTVYQLQDDQDMPAKAEFDDDGNRIARYKIVARCDNESHAIAVAKGL